MSEEREALRKQRLWEEHLKELKAKEARAKKRAYNRGYRRKVRLSPQAYQHRLETNREYNRRYRAVHKSDPVWQERRREEARKWYAKPENKAKQHEYYLRWKEANPEAYAAKLEKNRERRKAKKNGSKGSGVDA